jgi:nitrate/TMAO reductase-like tetraheme cytochrome c subunit
MPKFSFAGLKNPGTRTRLIIWLGAGVLGLAAIVIVALGATSSYWFCASACHKVQDDSITAYNHSSHSNISCMACHMPVNADPFTFVLHKAEALGELYMTVTNNYELPLNGHNHVSLAMSDKQCTQCHNLDNRDVTPSKGVIINHKAHAEKGVACTVCHNRVAHKEDFDLTLTSPDGEPNKKHADFMEMNGCFRCHTQDGPKVIGASEEETAHMTAPGDCKLCHPKDFPLKPASHNSKEFFPAGHAEKASEVESEVVVAEKEHEEFVAELKPAAHGGESVGLTIPSMGTVNECMTCHKEAFCTGCHGMEIPHPEEFKTPKEADAPEGHPATSQKLPKKCVMCHGDNNKEHFCDSCHHGEKVGYEYDKAVAWKTQHPAAVEKSGLDSCFKQCHEKKFCVDCHTKTGVVPGSHKKRTWLHDKTTVTVYSKQAAKPSAAHALEAQKSIESCEICHGSGGPNAKFCKGCHKNEMPHTDEFKKFHSKTGRKSPAVCQNCHQFKEICSNCHHLGSSKSKPWISQHGDAAVKNGLATCTEKCHVKKYCNDCHNSSNAVPSSHKAKNFTRDYSKNKAGHTKLYAQNAELCTYCHGNGGTNSKFCQGCHKVNMPHPADGSEQKFPHKEGFDQKKYSKKTCVNCHTQYFCDSCHHKGAVSKKPWVRYHPNIVRKDGAEPCFKCHAEIYCSNCHVNLAKRGLLN